MIKYIEVNENKVPKYKFEYAKESHKEMQNAAILVPENVVVVDFDGDNLGKNRLPYDEKIIFYLLEKYKPYWTKSRAHHFQLFFKIPNDKELKMKMSADILTIGGFQVDYKVGKNSLAIIKTGGKLRECACELTEEVIGKLPILPSICYPLYKNNNNTSFIELEDGDGRNDLLFHHIIFARKRYPTLNLEEPICFINEFLFKDKLDDKIIDSMIKRAPQYVSKTVEEINLLESEPKKPELIRFSDVETVEPKWIWYPYIPLGTLVLMVGDPGIGKSYIALKIASIISNGEQFPFSDYEKSYLREPAKVLFQNGEDGVSYTLSLRLDKLNADKSNIFMINEREEIFKLDQIEALEEVINETNCKLIVIDPIQRYLPDGKSMDKANEVRASLSPLINLAEKYECTIIIIMHRNKNSSNSSLYRALGSIDFVGACRSMLSIEKRETGTYITHDKSSLGEKGKPIRYQITNSGLEFIEQLDSLEEEKDSSKKLEKAMDMILSKLKEGPASAFEIFALGATENVSESTLKRAKKLLNVKSEQKDKQWYWYLNNELKSEEKDKDGDE